MTYSVEVINQRTLKRKLAKPQTQLTLANDLLIVCTENANSTQGTVVALEYNTPDMPERWIVDLPVGYTIRFSVFSPRDNLLILAVNNWQTVSNENSFLLALDGTTGQEKWRYPEIGYLNNLSAPVLIRDQLFVISDRHAFFLPLNQPWRIIWTVTFPFDYPWLFQAIAWDDQMFYVSAKKNGVIALSQADGSMEKQYQLQAEEGEVRLAAAVDNQRVIVGTSTGWVIAFDKTTTKPLWSQQIGRAITTGPLLDPPLVFVGAKAMTHQTYEIIALTLSDGNRDESGFEAFRLGAYGHFNTPLAMTSEKTLLCGSDKGYLYGLDNMTGQEQWRHFVQKPISCQPLYSPNNDIIIATRNSLVNVLHVTRKVEPPTKRIDKRRLRDFLYQHFDLSELRGLCFDLGIKHEDVFGSTVGEFAQALIEYCERRSSLHNLYLKARDLRPRAKW